MAAYKGKKILLIDGGSRQVLPMIKGFHQQGCEVTVYCGSKWDVGYACRYTDKRIIDAYDMADAQKTYDGIRRAITENHFELVVPMNDFAATILAEHKTELSAYAYICVNDYEIFALALDKLATMKLCMDDDIPCPKTALFETIEAFDPSGWQYPLVIKPRSGYGAKGFNTVNSHEELLRHFNATEQKFGPALVQEYIPQTAQQYQVEMYMDRNQQCCSILIMDKLRWYPINGGSSTLNVTIKDEEIKCHCIQLLQRMKWHGYASLDLIRDPRDGQAKILEINPRINGTAKICFAAGVDLALQHLEDACGEPITHFCDYPAGIYLRYIHMDILWFLKSSQRFTAKPSWFQWKNTIDEIFAWDDLKPFWVYSVTAIKKLFGDKKARSA